MKGYSVKKSRPQQHDCIYELTGGFFKRLPSITLCCVDVANFELLGC